MRWWPGWDLRKDPFAGGEILDPRTYGGILRFLIVSGFGVWGLWYIDDFFVWSGIVDEVDPREQAWHRLLTIGLAIAGYGSALVAAALVFLRHRRERQIRESAKGQWYDRTDLTHEDLYGPSAGMVGQDDEGETPDSASRTFQRK